MTPADMAKAKARVRRLGSFTSFGKKTSEAPIPVDAAAAMTRPKAMAHVLVSMSWVAIVYDMLLCCIDGDVCGEYYVLIRDVCLNKGTRIERWCYDF